VIRPRPIQFSSSENNAQGVDVSSSQEQEMFRASSSKLSRRSHRPSRRRRQFGEHSLAGMMKTSTCALHVTDREGCRQTSSCELHVTDRGGICRGVSSGSEGRTELRRKRDESLDTVLVLLVRRGFGGICRNQATEFMLWGVADSFQSELRFRLWF
jgi:hypothetical protein